MSVISDYKKARRKLMRRRTNLRKRGYDKLLNIPNIPKIPKKITPASIRRLTNLIIKTPTIRQVKKELFSDIGFDINSKKKTAKKQTTKKQTAKKKTTKKQTPKKKTAPKKRDKYLPNESDMIKESSLSFFANVDTLDSFIAQMNVSSRRGNNTHRSNVHDLSNMLRQQFEKACFADGETTVNKRLQDNAELVNRAMETIEGYYKSSDEEALQEAIDAIEDLISIITDSPINQDTAKLLEDVYNDTLSSYLTYDDMGGEFITEVADNKRLVIDPETGELLDSFAI